MSEYRLHKDFEQRPTLDIGRLEEINSKIDLIFRPDHTIYPFGEKPPPAKFELTKGYETFKAESLAFLKVHLLHHPEWAKCDKVEIKFHHYGRDGLSHYLTIEVNNKVRVYFSTSDEDTYLEHKDELIEIGKSILKPGSWLTRAKLFAIIWAVIVALALVALGFALVHHPYFKLINAGVVCLALMNLPLHWLLTALFIKPKIDLKLFPNVSGPSSD